MRARNGRSSLFPCRGFTDNLLRSPENSFPDAQAESASTCTASAQQWWNCTSQCAVCSVQLGNCTVAQSQWWNCTSQCAVCKVQWGNCTAARPTVVELHIPPMIACSSPPWSHRRAFPTSSNVLATNHVCTRSTQYTSGRQDLFPRCPPLGPPNSCRG